MEAAKFGNAATLACVLVLCITSMSFTWYNVSEVARLQSRVERLEAEDKSSGISQLLGKLGVRTAVYQEDDAEEGIPGHERKVRQVDPFRLLLQEIVESQLEAHLNCSTDEETKCTIEPGPMGDPGPPGPPGETGPQGLKGDRGEEGTQGYTGFKGQEGKKGEVGQRGLQGLKGERGEKGDMGTRGPVGETGERGDLGPRGIMGQIGYPGYKGQKGEVGDQGVVGRIGERGEKGDEGPQGPSGGEKGERGGGGPIGPKGDKGQRGQFGNTGYKGGKGEVGDQGVVGPAGERGVMGPQGPSGGEKGETGNAGPKGEMGAKGDKGLLGYPGYKGNKGAHGLQGERGPVGVIGEKGGTGAQGPVGEKGEMGVQGITGLKGQTGEKGDMGTRGPLGEKGTRGDTGPMGPTGAKGQPGYPGFKGNPGVKGEMGEKGDQGGQGLPGEPGPQGEKGEQDYDQLRGLYSCEGTTGWTRVAYLDMTNSNHQCPGDMQEVTLSGKRVCERSASALWSCGSATFSTNGLQYSHVCGRITGYMYRGVGAFGYYSTQSIDSYYVDGVTVTNGPPGSREHVWTFATGFSENDRRVYACPCAPNAPSITVPPFVGQDYFCESGRGGVDAVQNRLHSEDPLWDGDGCTAGNTCCEFNNPPYFTKHLTNSTSNALEVRVCGRYRRIYEDTLIELIELYVK